MNFLSRLEALPAMAFMTAPLVLKTIVQGPLLGSICLKRPGPLKFSKFARGFLYNIFETGGDIESIKQRGAGFLNNTVGIINVTIYGGVRQDQYVYIA